MELKWLVNQQSLFSVVLDWILAKYQSTLKFAINNLLEPVHFGPKLRATIVQSLQEQVEELTLATNGVKWNWAGEKVNMKENW